MSVKVATTRVACNTGTGTQDITISGFGTPVAAKLIAVRAATDGAAADGLVLSWGITDGTRQLCITHEDEHNLDTSDCLMARTTSALVVINDGAADNVVDGSAAFSAWITDGIRINWTDAPAGAYLLIVTLYGGTDVTAYAGEMDLGTGTSAIDITDPGFEPDIVECALAWSAASGANADMSFGVIHNDRAGAVTQGCYAIRLRNGVGTSANYGIMRSDACLSLLGNSIETAYLTASAFDSSGFSVTPSASFASREFYYLAIRLGTTPPVAAKVYTYTTPTGAGSNTDSGPGFTPQHIAYITGLAEAAATYYSDNRAGSVGFAEIDASAQYHATVASEDGAGTTNTQSLSDNQAINQPDDDGTTIAAATFTSFGATGATYSYSTAPATAKLWVALAIEAESWGGSTYEESISLGRSLGQTLAQNAVLESPLALGRNVSMALANAAVFEESMSLGRELAATPGQNADLADSVGLGRALAVSPIEDMTFESALLLGRALAISPVENVTFENALTLSRILTAAFNNIAVLEDALSMGRTQGLGIAGGLELADTISLGRSLALALADVITKEESISLDLARALALANTLDAAEDLTLERSLGIDAGSQAIFEATITLGRGQAITLSASLTLEQAITLGAALSLAAAADSAGFVALTFGIVRGPSGSGSVGSGGAGAVTGPTGEGSIGV